MQTLRQFLTKIKYTPYQLKQKLPYGMSNNTYLITYKDQELVVRLPKKTRHKYLLPANEALFYQAGDYLFLNKQGYLIKPYFTGITYRYIYPLNDNYLALVINKIKELHANTINYLNLKEYHLVAWLHKMYRKCFKYLEGSINMQINKYLEIIRYLDNHFLKENKAIIHGDLQLNNILLDYQKQIHLLDYEYVTYDSIYYDLGSLYLDTNYDLNKLTALYFGVSSGEARLATLGGALVYALRWYYIALFKAHDKYYQKDYDYNEIASYFLSQAATIYKQIMDQNE